MAHGLIVSLFERRLRRAEPDRRVSGRKQGNGDRKQMFSPSRAQRRTKFGYAEARKRLQKNKPFRQAEWQPSLLELSRREMDERNSTFFR